MAWGSSVPLMTSRSGRPPPAACRRQLAPPWGGSGGASGGAHIMWDDPAPTRWRRGRMGAYFSTRTAALPGTATHSHPPLPPHSRIVWQSSAPLQRRVPSFFGGEQQRWWGERPPATRAPSAFTNAGQPFPRFKLPRTPPAATPPAVPAAPLVSCEPPHPRPPRTTTNHPPPQPYEAATTRHRYSLLRPPSPASD